MYIRIFDSDYIVALWFVRSCNSKQVLGYISALVLVQVKTCKFGQSETLNCRQICICLCLPCDALVTSPWSFQGVTQQLDDTYRAPDCN